MLLLRTKVVLAGLIGAAAVLPVDLAEAQQVGHASWYALYSRTASGEMMNPSALTAAHRSLPFGTKVVVENLANGRSVVVRINDRGPFIGGRVIDLSKAAAAHIGMVHSGTARVRITTAGGTKVASVDAASQVEKGKSLAAKAAASEPSDAKPEPASKVAEAPEPRAVTKPSGRKVSSKKPGASKKAVASKTRANGTRVASKTRAKGTRGATKMAASNSRASGRSGSTRVASAQKTQRARSAAKRRSVVAVAQANPYAGFAPAALRAG